MYKTIGEAVAFVREFAGLVSDLDDLDIVVAPPFTALAAAADAARGSRVRVAGQDLYWEREGAFTGEISGAMLRDAGATLVIIGHSERRTKFGETDSRRQPQGSRGAGRRPGARSSASARRSTSARPTRPRRAGSADAGRGWTG